MIGHGRSVEWFEASDAKELKAALLSKNVISWCRYSRCIGTDDGMVHDKYQPLEELQDEDLVWAAEKENLRSRYLSCVRRLA